MTAVISASKVASSPRAATWFGFMAIAAFYRITEPTAHVFGALPWLLLLACPLMHVFMHWGTGISAAHRSLTNSKVIRAEPNEEAKDATADSGIAVARVVRPVYTVGARCG